MQLNESIANTSTCAAFYSAGANTDSHRVNVFQQTCIHLVVGGR